jgi:hypothetical protein
MFQASLGSGFGAQECGLHASIRAAVAYDELCSLYKIEITFEPQAIIIAGRIPPAVAKRACEIILEVCGSVSVWDRTFWL